MTRTINDVLRRQREMAGDQDDQNNPDDRDDQDGWIFRALGRKAATLTV